MKDTDNVFPILMNYNDKVIRLMEIVYEKDNSIYFVFPRKCGYKITKDVVQKFSNEKLAPNEYRINKVNFKNVDEVYCNPKISFHPRDMVVHVKSQDNKLLEENYPIYNIAPEGLFCYLIQIIFPLNFTIFDEYKKMKYRNILNINNNEMIDSTKLNFKDRNLNIEIFVHSSEYEPTEGSLPICLNRNFKYMATFHHAKLYSHTIVVSEIEAHNNEDIIININSKWSHIIYNLKSD